jgi:type I restriction enzyme S subunit
MKIKPYERYKPSGVEWLGEVPEHWMSFALRRTSTRYAGGTPDRSNDSYWEDGTIPWINSGAVNQGLITEPSAYITEEGYRNSSARWVAKGALVMALAGQGKTKGRVAQSGIVTTCNQSMAAICPKSPIDTRYLYWLLVSQYEHIRNMAGGEARDGLNLEILGAIPCLRVPPAEQRCIAVFLDRETERIDRLVVKKRELIERLKEKRTALISSTVTRGLPPAAARAAGLLANPPLKPSGIDWLDNIPEHWEMKRLGFLCVLESGENITSEVIAEGGDFPVYGGNGFRGYYHQFTHDGHFVLIGRQGALCGNINYGNGKFWASEHALIVIPTMQWDVVWMGELLRSMNLGRHSVTAAQPGLAAEMLRRLRVPVPPLREQTAIATYLNAETAKLDALLAKVEEAIERLQEYRTALITAAVTGKIDVRESARPATFLKGAHE